LDQASSLRSLASAMRRSFTLLLAACLGRAHETSLPEVPLAAKAFHQVFKSKGLKVKGRDPNRKLKLFLTSGGLLPTSTATQKEAFRTAAAKTAGNGALFLLDAKMLTLQRQRVATDPNLYNDQADVAYVREPSTPGGTPVYDSSGKLLPKTQDQLLHSHMHIANAVYHMRHLGEYSNFDLGLITGNGTEATPVYLSYLWYTGKQVDGKPEYKIMLAEGFSRAGKFTAKKTNGEEFAEEDYEAPWAAKLDSDETALFRSVSPADFANAVSSIKVVASCGGNSFLIAKALEPFFRNNRGEVLKEHPNLYGQSILNATRDGDVVYLGQSAGTVVMSWMLGPATEDPSTVLLRINDTATMNLSLGMNYLLGNGWMFPSVADYIGLSQRMVFRPHVGMRRDGGLADGSTKGQEKGLRILSDITGASPGAFLKDIWAVTMYDYAWGRGKSDLVEVSDGRIRYHVGYGGDEVYSLSAQAAVNLKSAYPAFASGCKLDAENRTEILRQPHGNPETGWTFDWTPADGEIIAAGPSAKRPFRLYISENSRFQLDAPPYSESCF